MKNIFRHKSERFIQILIAVLAAGISINGAFAQESSSVLYVPLIGITSVPQPLSLPEGGGDVTYNYAVKNFLREAPLTDVQVLDDKCSSVKFIEGDDNHDSKLDYNETWRYSCTAKISITTESVATATGTANDTTATHKAYATVVVGSHNPYPLVSIVNITKVSYPLSLPAGGGKITFTYRVNNPGIVSLGGVSVVDNKCSAMSGKLGDTNYNNLLDINEVWIYTCTTYLTKTTTNTVHVTAYANGFKAVGEATLTVKVDIPKVGSSVESVPILPDTGVRPTFKIIVWGILSAVLMALIIFSVLTRDKQTRKIHKKTKSSLKIILIVVSLAGVAGVGAYFLLLSEPNQAKAPNTLADNLFGWKYPGDKFPVPKFPIVGPNGDQIAYSSIRDPGGIPEGLPVRLKVPIIGVDSAIEDAFITPDGRMDVPSGSLNVAWFALGPKPGMEGSAVIGGHYGIYNDNRGPSVFYNLDKLVVGDKVYVVDDKGDTLGFIVRRIELFDRNADATTVFTSNDGLAHLNLITCEGTWNQVNGTYPDRRVVFTDAIPLEGAAVEPSSTGLLPVFTRSLSVGSRGSDVAELQSILMQKGFLVLSPGYSLGYFGVLTRGAIIRYQLNAGLPPVGIFGPLTRARLLSDLQLARLKLPVTAIETTTAPVSPSTVEKSNSFNQIFFQGMRNLYSNLADATITFFLLISIIFLAFKIIRR